MHVCTTWSKHVWPGSQVDLFHCSGKRNHSIFQEPGWRHTFVIVTPKQDAHSLSAVHCTSSCALSFTFLGKLCPAAILLGRVILIIYPGEVYTILGCMTNTTQVHPCVNRCMRCFMKVKTDLNLVSSAHTPAQVIPLDRPLVAEATTSWHGPASSGPEDGHGYLRICVAVTRMVDRICDLSLGWI
jgi:hypothetical protein